MISERLLEKLNNQLNYEFYSAQVYLAVAGYCEEKSLPGFANFFRVQAEEERVHAMKFFEFITSLGLRVHITGFGTPQNDFSTMVEVFEKAIQHEKEVTARIYELSDIALNDREHATMSFLKWFIDEQVEEMDMFDNLLQRLRRINEDSSAFFMMDDELAKRKLEI
ncbi:MAG TPA: ferritin [Massilibacterium sp.]|nr:ferritin [Massilibacterium sp.]